MPTHDHALKLAHDDRRRPKKGSRKGPKEKEIAATLTAAAVALAGGGVTYPSLDAAGDAVAEIYARMFELVATPGDGDA